MRKIILAAAALGIASTPAYAQLNTSQGLVDVTLQNVDILKNFLNNDQISALNNISAPITVSVPVGVAANVCGVNANVLAKQKKTGAATCDAKSGSKALAQNVIAQKLTQKK